MQTIATALFLKSVESWNSDEQQTEDVMIDVDAAFLRTLLGDNHKARVYMDKSFAEHIIQHDLQLTIIIDGDQDGFYEGKVPLSSRVGLVMEMD